MYKKHYLFIILLSGLTASLPFLLNHQFNVTDKDQGSIELFYFPKSFKYGLYVAFIGILFLFVLFIFHEKILYNSKHGH